MISECCDTPVGGSAELHKSIYSHVSRRTGSRTHKLERCNNACTVVSTISHFAVPATASEVLGFKRTAAGFATSIAFEPQHEMHRCTPHHIWYRMETQLWGDAICVLLLRLPCAWRVRCPRWSTLQCARWVNLLYRFTLELKVYMKCRPTWDGEKLPRFIWLETTLWDLSSPR